MAANRDMEGCVLDGKYEVVSKIQSGFFGTTWFAKDLKNQSEVCVKTFFTESRSQDKELTVLKQLSDGHFHHDNLCAVLAVSTLRAPVTTWRGECLFNTRYVVFEYCSGSDLFNFLVTGPFQKIRRVSGFPEALARHYITQALLAVTYLHERGVFHRDIKPENFVLDNHFNLKLTDFGTNKILSLSDDPSQVLRTATKGIGTDSYRAPEVNGIHGYDPSAADIWSLGVTLFFMVGIEEMFERANRLDHYSKQLLAPLGILFPFPLHCSKLDSYLREEHEVLQGPPVTNRSFWSEWPNMSDHLSSQLINLFNKIFLLQSSLRITLRDFIRHPWVSMETKLKPLEITRLMKERCPREVTPNLEASPKVVANKLLGGVDQATLRQALSHHSDQNPVSEYLSDSDVWLFTDIVRQLEALQLDIITSDLQEVIMDVNLGRQLLRDVLSAPHDETIRTIKVSSLPTTWLTRMLMIVGFLPQGNLLYLPKGNLDLILIDRAVSMLTGVELAVTRSAVPFCSFDEDMMSEPTTASSLPSYIEGQSLMELHLPSNDSGCSTLHTDSQPEDVSHDYHATSHDYHKLRKYSSNPEFVVESSAETMATDHMTNPLTSPVSSQPTHIDSQNSQESMQWFTGGESLSAQSSQEELPEIMMDNRFHDYSDVHSLIALNVLVDVKSIKQFRAASAFCKLSGLLCSYGLYQVVAEEQLALYCRGNQASFSARIVLTQNSEVCISTWCFYGNEEWRAILKRIDNDMKSKR